MERFHFVAVSKQLHIVFSERFTIDYKIEQFLKKNRTITKEDSTIPKVHRMISREYLTISWYI